MEFTETKEKAKSAFKKILWIALILSIISGIGYYFVRTYTVSEGTRTGTLFKISKKGAIFKTYEGQLQLANAQIMNKESIWAFSTTDDQVYQTLQNLEGKNVRLSYEEKYDAFCWQGDTDYIIVKAEEVK